LICLHHVSADPQPIAFVPGELTTEHNGRFLGSMFLHGLIGGIILSLLCYDLRVPVWNRSIFLVVMFCAAGFGVYWARKTASRETFAVFGMFAILVSGMGALVGSLVLCAIS